MSTMSTKREQSKLYRARLDDLVEEEHQRQKQLASEGLAPRSPGSPFVRLTNGFHAMMRVRPHPSPSSDTHTTTAHACFLTTSLPSWQALMISSKAEAEAQEQDENDDSELMEMMSKLSTRKKEALKATMQKQLKAAEKKQANAGNRSPLSMRNSFSSPSKLLQKRFSFGR